MSRTVTYASLEPLIVRTTNEGRTVAVVFQCPVTGFKVASQSIMAAEGGLTLSHQADLAKRYATHSVRQSVGRTVSQMLGGGYAGMMARNATMKASQGAARSQAAGGGRERIFDEEDRQDAIVRAFRQVQDQFRWDAGRGGWVAASAPVDAGGGALRTAASGATAAGVDAHRNPPSASVDGQGGTPGTSTPPPPPSSGATASDRARPPRMAPPRPADRASRSAAPAARPGGARPAPRSAPPAPHTPTPAAAAQDYDGVLAAADLTGERAQDVLARALGEVALADGTVGEDEAALLDQLASHGLDDRARTAPEHPLSADELGALGAPEAEAVALLAMTLAYADERMEASESTVLDRLHAGLGVGRGRHAQLDRLARERVIQLFAAQRVAAGDDPGTVLREAVGRGARLGLPMTRVRQLVPRD